jgi:2-polyprenyl-3-methyl-5-hydroxy-6-metoxy-1,4-benzoquinol methylase
MNGSDYWTAQAVNYAHPNGRGFVRFAARRQHAAVLKLLAPRAGEHVLDAGCGTGLLTLELVARGARVWAVDYCQAMVDCVAKAETVSCADLETLALGVQFDAVVCAGALNFLDAPRALERLAAHTRPGGMMIVMVTRPSIAGLFYTASRKLMRVPFQLHSVRTLQDCAAQHGMELMARERTLPHDIVLAFRRRTP